MRLLTILALMLISIPAGATGTLSTTAMAIHQTFFCDYVPTWPGCRG